MLCICMVSSESRQYVVLLIEFIKLVFNDDYDKKNDSEQRLHVSIYLYIF